MDKRTYKRKPNEAEKEALLCYRYYNLPGSYVYSIDDEEGGMVIVHESFLSDKRYKDATVYTDHIDDPPHASELEGMRAAMFLSRPCGEDVESRVRSLLDALPLFPNDDPKTAALSLDPLAELGCEIFQSLDFRKDAETCLQSYCFPAGLVFNLAMESAAERLGVEGRLWELGEPRLKQLRADYGRSENIGERERASRADALVGMVQMTTALLSARKRFTWGVLNDWLDMIPYKPSPSPSGTRYWKTFGERVLRDAKRGKPTAPPRLNADRIAAARTEKEAATAEGFSHVEVSRNPKEIGCLMDVLYYTLRAFAVKSNRGNAYRCSSCGRIFFQDHGRQKYCLFRSPDPDYQGDPCQESVKKICAKRSNEVKRLRDVIANTLSKPHRGSVYPDKAYNDFIDRYGKMREALGKRDELDERLDRYAKQLEWLKAEYVRLFKKEYVPKEVKTK